MFVPPGVREAERLAREAAKKSSASVVVKPVTVASTGQAVVFGSVAVSDIGTKPQADRGHPVGLHV